MKILTLLLLPLCLTAQDKLKHTEKIERTFPAPKTVGVANISGSVHIIGYNGSQVQLTAVRTDEAATQELLDKASREVTLKTEVKDGMLQIYPDGPFRNNNYNGESRSPFDRSSRHDGPGYNFNFDITVKVPTSMNLDLRNVNKGEIKVEDVHGHFDVKHVNGPIEMKGMVGNGSVHSVNGKVLVAFNQNPTGPCDFKTVNGAVEVSLKPGLNADLKYKTLHGGVFTDFDLAGQPGATQGMAAKENGKFVYRSRGESQARIGSGGPALSFETINGEIRIRRQ